LTGSEAAVAGSSVDGKWYNGRFDGLTGAGTGTFSSRHTGNVPVGAVAGFADWQWVQRLCPAPLVGLTATSPAKA